MHSSKRVVARGDTGDRPVFHDSSPRSVAVVQAEQSSAVEHDDLRGGYRGGRRFSARAGTSDVLGGPTSRDPGAGNLDRQNRLLDSPPASVVPYWRLKQLATARVRREARRLNFDWEAFVASEPAWSLTEVVHRKAVEDAGRRGLDVRPTDVSTEVVLKVVQGVLEEMDADEALRPSEDGFREEQARRGELGRATQSAKAAVREAAVMELVASGVTNNSEIARIVKMSRAGVGDIRKRVAERKPAAEPVPALEQVRSSGWVFPAENVPVQERWPAWQFVMQTRVHLDEEQVRWICDMGRCYELEGRVDELMDVIRRCAVDKVRDPWAYLERCVVNRGDAWSVSAELLREVLEWAGKTRLQYALTAIGDGCVARPLPYLRRVLSVAVAAGKGRVFKPDRPLTMAVSMARQAAPELQVVGVDAAVAQEEENMESRHVESYRRRHGRLPWESEMDGSDCQNGLKRVWGDESRFFESKFKVIGSSPGPGKADLTFGDGGVDGEAGRLAGIRGEDDSAGLVCEKMEQPENPAESGEIGDDRCTESAGEARNRGKVTVTSSAQENPLGILEHGPCRHPLAALLVTAMDLEAVVQVECAAGCGHWLYSDRGPVECACHWSSALVGRVARVLQEGSHVSTGATEGASDSCR